MPSEMGVRNVFECWARGLSEFLKRVTGSCVGSKLEGQNDELISMTAGVTDL